MEKFEKKEEDKIQSIPERVQDLIHKIKPPDYNHEILENSVPCFLELLLDLAPAIREHKYNVILGDDSSGRIPALIIGGLMKKIYKDDGLKSPQILFLSGGRHTGEEEQRDKKVDKYVGKLLENKRIKPEDKILFVTEYLSSGQSEARIINILKKQGLTCGLAHLSTFMNEKEASEYSKTLKGVDVYKGTTSYISPLWGQYKMAGVEKVAGEALSQRRKKEDDKQGKDITLSAREDIKKMINYLNHGYEILYKDRDQKISNEKQFYEKL